MRVLMLTANLVAWDARVRKMARTAAEAGWDVTVISRSRTGRREESTIGGARVLELPVRSAADDWHGRHLPHFEGLARVAGELHPDLVHAHAIETLGVAIEVKQSAAKDGRPVNVVYD